ncbi:MAG TPA: Holliday junction resolvase RuvX [Candidatus Polarisedimenticolia bacterium]|jgi:putative Holliday junction resolvase|nr:Holliday junction resolvase RuvX [Candidatus Polarisedimenticolia bacterium]
MSRCLGLDVGERRIGVALSDPLGWTASPLPPIERASWKKDLARIRALLEEHEVARVVVGLPVRLDGTPGKSAERAMDLVRRLRGTTKVPVVTWDERLTTREAERRLIEADVSRARRKEVIDGMAASLILQGFLDAAGAPGEPG